MHLWASWVPGQTATRQSWRRSVTLASHGIGRSDVVTWTRDIYNAGFQRMRTGGPRSATMVRPLLSRTQLRPFLRVERTYPTARPRLTDSSPDFAPAPLLVMGSTDESRAAGTYGCRELIARVWAEVQAAPVAHGGYVDSSASTRSSCTNLVARNRCSSGWKPTHPKHIAARRKNRKEDHYGWRRTSAVNLREVAVARYAVCIGVACTCSFSQHHVAHKGCTGSAGLGWLKSSVNSSLLLRRVLRGQLKPQIKTN